MHDNTPHNDRFSSQFIDLLGEKVGGRALACSDEWFADCSNLVKPGRGIFQAGVFTDRGQLMDGWESRRSYGRDNGREYDWCVLRLGIPGRIHGVDIDTNNFRGNAPEYASLEGACVGGEVDDTTVWTEILPNSPTSAHSQNLFAITHDGHWTHLRLNLFPDGGVARLRAYGVPFITPANFVRGELIDLASVMNGSRSLACSDMFFSSPTNMLMPGRGVNMGDGWETKRRRNDNNDWCIIRLGVIGTIRRVIVDTAHFKGNFPDRVSLDAVFTERSDITADDIGWEPVLAPTKLYADKEHRFIRELQAPPMRVYNHVRVNIFPDGGVSRLRVFGFPEWWSMDAGL